ncbi:MAG: lamin tail domain-containing protein, partial [Luteolibacter sp.]
PYSAIWSPSAPGAYQVMARAIDAEGAEGRSSSSMVMVLAGDGQPIISEVDPPAATNGTSVRILGQNFADVSSVRFGGVEAEFAVNSLGEISAVVPPGAVSGLLQVENGYGVGTLEQLFEGLEAPVLISQVYGAGGNSGAVFNRDYIELYNRSDSLVALDGWSLQYASSSGTSWQVFELSGAIQPGDYHLIALGGGSIGADLPVPDQSGSINMSASKGKIALLRQTTALTGSSPLGDLELEDFVGYGDANVAETAPAPAPSATMAIFRAGGGAIDSGDNSADFTLGDPVPRNSSYQQNSAPVISSSLEAVTRVGNSFVYQITAEGLPNEFGAEGLPDGLVLDTESGEISGVAVAAGTAEIVMSASNSYGTGYATLVLTILPPGNGGPVTVFSEDFSSISLGNNTSTTGANSPWNGNDQFPSVTKAYQAGGVVKLGSGSSPGSMSTRVLDLSGNGGYFTVRFSVKGWTSVEGDIVVSVTGLPSQTVSYTSTMADDFEAVTLSFSGGQVGSVITFQTTAKRAYLDDVMVTQDSGSSTPAIITDDATLAAVSSVYGAASQSSSSFAIAGSGLSGAIQVTPPVGFEVSLDDVSFAETARIDAVAELAFQMVFIRLSAGVPAGSYAGEILIESPDADAVRLPMPSSDVLPKPITITANDAVKRHGVQLVFPLQSSAFRVDGLVAGDSVDSVQLRSDGADADAELGSYPIIPSAATGQSFLIQNYAIEYLAGSLLVKLFDYDDWIASLPGIGQAAAIDDPDQDGLVNLLEFFCGLDPSQPDTDPLEIEVTSDRVLVSYRKAKGLAGVDGALVWSDDLQLWDSAGFTEQSVSDMGGYLWITTSHPRSTDDSRKFIRLRVIQAPDVQPEP